MLCSNIVWKFSFVNNRLLVILIRYGFVENRANSLLSILVWTSLVLLIPYFRMSNVLPTLVNSTHTLLEYTHTLLE